MTQILDLFGFGLRRFSQLIFSISHRFHRCTQIIELFGLVAESQLRQKDFTRQVLRQFEIQRNT
ncbi:hypothetical protein KSW92_17260, partial [Prevotella copri]|uniref:hypothetical protein n=1 Tax=Segatella copri TaxID=165179 RepID=UPI001C38A16F